MPNSPLLNLPLELIIHVFCNLSISDLVSCRLTHTSLNLIIKSSTRIEFNNACQMAGVRANPNYTLNLSVKERIRLLKRLEDGWSHLNILFSQKVDVGHNTSGIHGLAGDLYFLGDRDASSIHYYKLPSKPSDSGQWSRIDVEGNILGIGISSHEHNLIAIVTSSPKDDGIHAMEIQIFDLTSQKSHHLARRPIIHVAHTPWPRPTVAIEIVGDRLALLANYTSNPDRPQDHLYVFDWKTAALEMHATAPNNSYASLLFLSPDTLLVPNLENHSLEFWRISNSNSKDQVPPRPIGALGLPMLERGYIMTGVTCRCDPNPTTNGTPFASRPLCTSAMDAIAMFNFHIQPPNVPSSTTFVMFSHRRALLNLCEDPGTARKMSRAQNAGTFAIPWSEWGPPITRYFVLTSTATRWNTTTAGQRYTIFLNSPASLTFLDFNTIRIKRLNSERADRDRNEMHTISRESGDVNTWFETKATSLRHHALRDPVVSKLPYMVCSLKKAHNYAGVLMSEQGLIGIQIDELERVTEFEFLGIGLEN